MATIDHTIYIYGMKFPNRIFVGGLPQTVDVRKIANGFEKYGVVTEAKIILKNNGTSKGYGFVTFASAEDVENVLKQQPMFYEGHKLNLGPAIRKQAPDIKGETVVVVAQNAENNMNESNESM